MLGTIIIGVVCFVGGLFAAYFMARNNPDIALRVIKNMSPEEFAGLMISEARKNLNKEVFDQVKADIEQKAKELVEKIKK
jgi:hypothetical protein